MFKDAARVLKWRCDEGNGVKGLERVLELPALGFSEGGGVDGTRMDPSSVWEDVGAMVGDRAGGATAGDEVGGATAGGKGKPGGGSMRLSAKYPWGPFLAPHLATSSARIPSMYSRTSWGMWTSAARLYVSQYAH